MHASYGLSSAVVNDIYDNLDLAHYFYNTISSEVLIAEESLAFSYNTDHIQGSFHVTDTCGRSMFLSIL